MTTGRWRAVALSESIAPAKLLGVVCDGHELVLYRDAAGLPFALEDRCPHRRVPLSLGSVKPGGLQCGYHGWTFDGGTGGCSAIPNLHNYERVPPRYGARAYRVHEADGFIQVWLGEGTAGGELPAADYRPTGREVTGAAVVSMAHREYLAAMLDGPQCLLRFAGVRITDFFLGDTRTEGDRLVLDRGAVWTTQLLPPAFVTDHPLIVRTAVPLVGGEIRVDLLSADEVPVVTVCIASGANRRGTTGLCWRGFQHDHNVAGAPLRWRAARAAGRPPFEVFRDVDGSAIAALLAVPSRDLDAARAVAVVRVGVAA